MNLQNSFMALACVLAFANGAVAQEDLIRKNLPARLPQFKQIDEVRKSEIPGLYEVRVDGTEIFYTDAKADFLIEGSLIDTRNKRNLTEERVESLTACRSKTRLPWCAETANARWRCSRTLIVATASALNVIFKKSITLPFTCFCIPFWVLIR